MNIIDVIKDQKEQLIYSKYASSVPFDVISFARNLGIEVIENSELPESTSGYIKEFNNKKIVICVNKSHYFNRKRFTVAHELGHYFLHREKLKEGVLEEVHREKLKNNIYNNAMYRDSNQVDSLDIENAANDFGANLLMPEMYFVKLWNRDDFSIRDMAKYFLVSESAIITRARFLDLISATEYWSYLF